MELQLIRSATLRLGYGGRTYLIDPWLAARGEGRSYAGELRSPLVDLPMPVPELLEGVDAVIVSHLHSDHFDDAARELLPRDIPILCAPADADAIAGDGFTRVTPIPDTRTEDGVRVRRVGGRHGPPEVLGDMGDVSGFVFSHPGEPTLYWAGDTIFCPEVAATIAAERPAVVVVHACGADWNGKGPLVMDVAMVREVLEAAPDATVVATHLDAVDHATVDRRMLRAFLDAEPGFAPRLRIPADGEALHFA